MKYSRTITEDLSKQRTVLFRETFALNHFFTMANINMGNLIWKFILCSCYHIFLRTLWSEAWGLSSVSSIFRIFNFFFNVYCYNRQLCPGLCDSFTSHIALSYLGNKLNKQCTRWISLMEFCPVVINYILKLYGSLTY